VARHVAARFAAKRGLAPLHHRGFRLLAAGQLASDLLGRLTGLLLTASFGVFPISVALAALVVHGLGAAPFFPLAAVTVAIPLLAGLSQRTWRDFGMIGGRATTAASGTQPVSAAADVLGSAS
jgi:hypothetical protein